MQGAFAEHEASLDKLHIPHFEIRQADDFQDDMDGLIIPGGESTVIGKLLKELSLYEPLKAKIEAGLPVFGTFCLCTARAHKRKKQVKTQEYG